MDKRKELLKLCGNMEQLAGVRRIEYQDGRASGLRCALVENGVLEFPLMLDKCLDPAWLRYRGMNMSFLSKPGLQGRNAYDTAGGEAIYSIMGGAMFTCGLGNVHGHRRIGGTDYPTHGRIRTTPAEKVSMDAFWDGGEYRIRVTGEMREARLFGENMVLRRTVETAYGSPWIRFVDTIENQGAEPQPLLLLYHCNAGYPFLSPGARILVPELSCEPRDSEAERGMQDRGCMEEPEDGCPEQVFQYTLAADSEGNTFGAIVNDALELALCIRWNVRRLPFMTQWKSRASCDYAMALEPANCGFGGRAGETQKLEAFGTYVNELQFCVVEGKEAIQKLEEERRGLCARGPYGSGMSGNITVHTPLS